jgi:hypothetical protein
MGIPPKLALFLYFCKDCYNPFSLSTITLMQLKFLSFLLLMTFLPAAHLFSQKESDYGTYANAAGNYMNLYRGAAPMKYKFLHLGTFYAYSETFEKGEVKYNGRIYSDVWMNLNSHMDELYVKIPYSGREVVLNKSLVEYFTIGKRKFVNRGGAYFELLFDGKSKLYKRIRKVYSEKIASSVNPLTGSRLEKSFEHQESYILNKDGGEFRILRKSSLLSLYPEKRGEINRKLREEKISAQSEKSLVFARILQIAESN